MAFTGMCTTWRTVGFPTYGTTTAPQVIFTIENLASSSVTVTIRRLLLQNDPTAAAAFYMPLIRTVRFATPASVVGTTLAKGTFNSAEASSTLVQVRATVASDGSTTSTTLTVVGGTTHWQLFPNRLHTAVGQVMANDINCLPNLVADTNYGFRLYAGQGLAVQIIAPAYTLQNPATNNYFVNCVWTET